MVSSSLFKERVDEFFCNFVSPYSVPSESLLKPLVSIAMGPPACSLLFSGYLGSNSSGFMSPKIASREGSLSSSSRPLIVWNCELGILLKDWANCPTTENYPEIGPLLVLNFFSFCMCWLLRLRSNRPSWEARVLRSSFLRVIVLVEISCRIFASFSIISLCSPFRFVLRDFAIVF